MEHPLISDAQNLSLEELQTRISDLHKKLAWAQRSNAHLASQISMALETYNNQYLIKQKELWDKKSGDSDYSDRIDIS